MRSQATAQSPSNTFSLQSRPPAARGKKAEARTGRASASQSKEARGRRDWRHSGGQDAGGRAEIGKRVLNVVRAGSVTEMTEFNPLAAAKQPRCSAAHPGHAGQLHLRYVMRNWPTACTTYVHAGELKTWRFPWSIRWLSFFPYSNSGAVTWLKASFIVAWGRSPGGSAQ